MVKGSAGHVQSDGTVVALSHAWILSTDGNQGAPAWEEAYLVGEGFTMGLIAVRLLLITHRRDLLEGAGIAMGLAELPSSHAPGSESTEAMGNTKEYCTLIVIY